MDKVEQRKNLEYIARVLSVPGSTIRQSGYAGPVDDAVFVVATGGAAVFPPPLPPFKHLFLSALLGEPIPPAVLLAALEDSGVFPNGVLAAAGEAEAALRDAPIEFDTPVYTEGEGWRPGEDRADLSLYPFMRSKQAELYGLCKGVFGRGQAHIGNMYSDFLHQWFGMRSVDSRRSDRWPARWPTDEYIRDRIANLPPLGRILRHLRRGAKAKTAEAFTRLIDHLDGQRG